MIYRIIKDDINLKIMEIINKNNKKIDINNIIEIENYCRNKYGFSVFISIELDERSESLDDKYVNYDVLDMSNNVYNFKFYY